MSSLEESKVTDDTTAFVPEDSREDTLWVLSAASVLIAEIYSSIIEWEDDAVRVAS